VLVVHATPRMHAARLEPKSVAGWSAYVAVAEARMARELDSTGRFLGIDFDRDGAAEREAVLTGRVVIRRLQASATDGRSIQVGSARVHHWRGAVFIPGVILSDLIAELQRTVPPAGQDDILDSRLLERGPDRMRVYLKLQRHKFVTVVYDTEHLVTFKRYAATRAATATVATKIAELENPGTPNERERPEGDDRGFLWKLNAYWRYEQVRGGVIAECESISLSRDVPGVLRSLVDPLIESTARESLDRTLTSFRTRFARR
jgi:hypothetical protein